MLKGSSFRFIITHLGLIVWYIFKGYFFRTMYIILYHGSVIISDFRLILVTLVQDYPRFKSFQPFQITAEILISTEIKDNVNYMLFEKLLFRCQYVFTFLS